MDFMVFSRSLTTTTGSLETGWGDCAPACPTVANSAPAAVKARAVLRAMLKGSNPFDVMKLLTQHSPSRIERKLDAQRDPAIPLQKRIIYSENPLPSPVA